MAARYQRYSPVVRDGAGAAGDDGRDVTKDGGWTHANLRSGEHRSVSSLLFSMIGFGVGRQQMIEATKTDPSWYRAAH